MYQVIARKYRPQNFSELVGQEHVRTTIENAIAQKRIAHGYIFSGQRGTGKTTVARILARCLNCVNGPTPTPCGVCASCIEIAKGGAVDVIEIDAASNRGINEMRELRESVRYRPARDLYKVFIVDEAHQITNEAFNALLKTIEEPPPWAVFVMCTTESHKIPATIASRCQHFSFRSVDFDDLTERMAWICAQEGIEADAEALAVLAAAGEGSVRDSLSALDQAIACCGAKLEAAPVRALLGAFSLESLERVTAALIAGDARAMLEVVDELERNGQNLQHFSRELSRYFRNLLVARVAGNQTRLIAASAAQRQKMAELAAQFTEDDLTRYLQLSLEIFKELQYSLQPRFHLEMGLVRLVQASRLLPIEEAIANLGSAPAPRTPSPQAGPPKPPPPAPPPPPKRVGPSPFEMDSAKKVAYDPPPTPMPPGPPPGPPVVESTGGWRGRLHAALMELGMPFTADAIENASVVEANNELQVTTTKAYSLALKPDDLNKALRQITQKPMRVKIIIGEPAAQAAPLAAPLASGAKKTAASEDEAEARALANPEVQRFREVFPDGEIRKVRNLKE